MVGIHGIPLGLSRFCRCSEPQQTFKLWKSFDSLILIFVPFARENTYIWVLYVRIPNILVLIPTFFLKQWAQDIIRTSFWKYDSTNYLDYLKMYSHLKQTGIYLKVFSSITFFETCTSKNWGNSEQCTHTDKNLILYIERERVCDIGYLYT